MKRDVIIFAGALYDSKLWTNRQQIATRLAERGHKVFYVEPRHFWLTMLLGQFPGSGSHLHWLFRSHWPHEVRNNLWVISQFNVMPWSREVNWISLLNHWLNAPTVHLHAFLRGFKDPAILIYDTEAAQYLGRFPKSRIVYDCVDDHRVQAGVNRNSERVEAEEVLIAKAADAISVTTEILYERFSKLNKNVVLIPNAADINLFKNFSGSEPEDLKNIPHPRIGTVGALDVYKVDFSMLFNVASKHPEWHFVLVGPVEHIGVRNEGLGITKLKELANVHFLGEKKKDDVPAYVHNFDVAIIPYVKSDYNDASFPLKFWEFMVSGKPVVATNLPTLSKYQYLFSLTRNEEEFEKGIVVALQENEKNNVPRIAEAELHDWSKRVDAIEKLLQ
ncbi:MAG: glycosyltransferase [bacterium]|nr:glycosyltransferase [bacterium]